HRAPFGEAGAEAVVLLEPVAQAVQALGDHLARESGQRMGALVDLDAGDDAGILHHPGEGHAVLARLAQGLVEQDRAGDVLAQAGRGQQHLAVGAAVLLGVLHAHAGEALGDGAGGFVDGDDALARRDHGAGGVGELFDAHGHPQSGWTADYRRYRKGFGRQMTPSPSASPSEPTFNNRRVFVAPCCSMWSPLVKTMRSPSARNPCSNSKRTAARAASRVASPRLSKATGNT